MDGAFPVHVRIVSGRLQNALLLQRYLPSTLWSNRIHTVGGPARVNLDGGRSQRPRFLAYRPRHFRHFQISG
ncbi:hypothetical protein ARTHRO9AX_100148 [Arthrobacter sp. 9AX]|nr:hypothetical protein ARTHRO9AX_100148 [Arthrobacter sp. 9AX]